MQHFSPLVAQILKEIRLPYIDSVGKSLNETNSASKYAGDITYLEIAY